MVEENKTPEQEKTQSEDKPEFEKKLEEMRAENARMEKNISEMRRLKALDALSGKTEAGNTVPQKPVEETPEEYAKKALAGKLNIVEE